MSSRSCSKKIYSSSLEKALQVILSGLLVLARQWICLRWAIGPSREFDSRSNQGVQHVQMIFELLFILKLLKYLRMVRFAGLS